jgi:hypothetical protein
MRAKVRSRVVARLEESGKATDRIVDGMRPRIREFIRARRPQHEDSWVAVDTIEVPCFDSGELLQNAREIGLDLHQRERVATIGLVSFLRQNVAFLTLAMTMTLVMLSPAAQHLLPWLQTSMLALLVLLFLAVAGFAWSGIVQHMRQMEAEREEGPKRLRKATLASVAASIETFRAKREQIIDAYLRTLEEWVSAELDRITNEVRQRWEQVSASSQIASLAHESRRRHLDGAEDTSIASRITRLKTLINSAGEQT